MFHDEYFVLVQHSNFVSWQGEYRTSDWHTFVKLPISHTDLSLSSMCFVLKMTNYEFLVCDVFLGQDQVCALIYYYISFFFMLEAKVFNYTQFI